MKYSGLHQLFHEILWFTPDIILNVLAYTRYFIKCCGLQFRYFIKYCSLHQIFMKYSGSQQILHEVFWFTPDI